MKNKLETVVNITIVILCVTAAAAFAKVHLFSDPTPLSPVAKGDILKPVRGLAPKGDGSALLVALSPTCGYCTDSFPFFKTLEERRNNRGAKVRLLAAVNSKQDMAQENELLESSGVTFDDVVVVDFLSIRVPGTPTILHVDGDGNVLDVWLGRLDQATENEVLQVFEARLL